MEIPVLEGNDREKARKLHCGIWEREVNVYRSFQKNIADPHSVLYPGCGFNISPSEVFDEITYVDPSYSVWPTLTICGFDCVRTHIENYVPEKEFNLLILQGFFSEKALDYIVKGGHIILGPYNSHSLGSVFKEAEIIENTERFSLCGEINFIDTENEKDNRIKFVRSLEDKLTKSTKIHQGRKKIGADWYIFERKH